MATTRGLWALTVIGLMAAVVLGGDWGKPQEVLRVRSLNEFDAVHTVDNESTTHYAWCNNTNGVIYYRALQVDGRLTPITQLTKDTFCRGTLDIVAPSMAKSLLICFNAIRSRSTDVQCTPSSPELCSDAYCVESFNAGRSFSAPFSVPRSDLKDIVNRAAPIIVSHWAHDRLWLFYAAFDEVKHSTHLRMVTRPPGSVIFVTETTILSLEDEYTFRGAFLTEGARTQLHVLLQDSTQQFVVMYSYDNGQTWTIPEPTQGACEEGDEQVLLVPGKQVLPASVFGLCVNDTSGFIYLKWSKDQGKTWDSVIRTTTNRIFQLPVVTAGNNAQPRLLMHFADDMGAYKFIWFQLKSELEEKNITGPADCTSRASYKVAADIAKAGIRATVADVLSANERVIKNYFHPDVFA